MQGRRRGRDSQKRDEDKSKEKNNNESGEGNAGRDDVTKKGESTQIPTNSNDQVIRKAKSNK